MSLRLDFGSLDSYAWFIPGVLVSALVAVPVSRRLARRFRVRRSVGMLLAFSFGAVLAATVTPSREALAGNPGVSAGCDFSQIGPSSLWAYTHISDASLNVLLFVPLGLSIGLLPSARVRGPLLLGAAVLSPLVETVQLFVPPLGRACQAADVTDNLMGLALGFGLGLALAWIGRQR